MVNLSSEQITMMLSIQHNLKQVTADVDSAMNNWQGELKKTASVATTAASNVENVGKAATGSGNGKLGGLGGMFSGLTGKISAPFSGLGSKLGNEFGELFSKSGVKHFGRLGKELGDVMAGSAKAAGPMVSGLGSMGGLLGGGLALGGPLAIIAAIVGYLALAASKAKLFMDAVARLGPHFDKMLDGGVRLMNYLAPCIDALIPLIDYLGQVFLATADIIIGILQTLAPVIQWVIDCIVGIVKPIFDIIATVVGFFMTAWGIITSATGDLQGKIIDIFFLLLRSIAEIASDILKVLLFIPKKFVETFGTSIDALVNFVFNALNGMVNGVIGIINGLIDKINGAIGWLGQSIGHIGAVDITFKGSYSQDLLNMMDAIENLPNSLLDMLGVPNIDDLKKKYGITAADYSQYDLRVPDTTKDNTKAVKDLTDAVQSKDMKSEIVISVSQTFNGPMTAEEQVQAGQDVQQQIMDGLRKGGITVA